MPINRGVDGNGPYYRWGTRKKYYYKSGDSVSRKRAYDLAVRQAQAIYSRGYAGE